MTHAVTGHRESRAGAAGKTAVNSNLRLGWGKITAESETFTGKGGGRLFAHSSSCKCDKKLAELLSFQVSNEHASHKRRATLSWVRLGMPGSPPGYTVPSSKRRAVSASARLDARFVVSRSGSSLSGERRACARAAWKVGNLRNKAQTQTDVPHGCDNQSSLHSPAVALVGEHVRWDVSVIVGSR